MPITLRGTPQIASTTNGADVTITFDVAPSEGDVVILFGGHGNDGTDSGGFGPITSGYTLIDSVSGADVVFGAWYKVMTATPDLTVAGEGGGDTGDAVAYGAYVIQGSTIDAAIFDQTATKVGQVTGRPRAPAIVTQTDGAMVLIAAGAHLTDTSIGTVTGYGNGLSAAPNDTDDITFGSATKIVAVAGTETPGTWSGWTSTTTRHIAITVALKPAAAPAFQPAWGTKATHIIGGIA